jgi:exonuclease SbcC
MLNSIQLHNFQSHRDTRLDFADGVNVIIGSSDSGKTAVLRALNWVVNNRPGGDAFRSRRGGDTIVEVELSGMSVVRKKTDRVNSYQISAGGKTVTDTVFKAMGAGVPAEVEKALGLTAVNIQYQLDSPFLLSSDWSPGQVAEYLNEVAGLDVIDRAAAGINAVCRRVTAAADAECTRLADLETRLAALDYIDAAEAAVADLEAGQAEASRQRGREQAVNNAVADIIGVRQQLDAVADYSGAEQEIDALIAINRQAAELTTSECELRKIATEAGLVAIAVAQLQRTTRAERLVNHLRQIANECEQINSHRQRIADALAEVGSGKRVLSAAQNEVVRLQADWQRLAPAVCPLCAGTGKLK